MELLILGDETKKPMFFIRYSSREVDSVTENQHIPQPIKLERRSVGSIDRSEKGAAIRIVIIDCAVAKISDPEFVTFDKGKSPWRVEVAVGNQTPNKIATRIEDVDKTIPGPGDIIVLLGIL
jgi:hypothetical protein